MIRNKYPFFTYVTKDSKVHLMNSKMKILWYLLSLLIIIALKDYISISLFLILNLFIIINTKIDITAYISNILLVWPIYVIAFLIGFLVTINPLTGILISIKFVFFIMVSLILTFTTSLSEIAWGMECLFIKLKKINIPVSRIALKIALWIKFISTLFDEYKNVRKSMAYRGVPYRMNKMTTFKHLIIPVITLSYKHSRRMVCAMKLRFYGYSKRRTNYHENKTTKFDKFLIFLQIIILYITIWLGWCA